MGFLVGKKAFPLVAATYLKYVVLILIVITAFGSRMFSVLRYESIIHEFDPWFNYRATEYLVENGFSSFITWFDAQAWYPLGRAVGATVYPGIMITAAALHKLAQFLGWNVSVKNTCVFVPPIFSMLTCFATFLVTKELSDDTGGLFAALFIAVVPGYISRSVAGSFDNEAIAIFILMATFYCWIKAVKSGLPSYAAAAAMFYYYMAASWGGYVFINNIIPLHAFTLMLFGKFSSRLYSAYSTYYVLGTLASMTVPFVGLQPIKSIEHMAALGVFGLTQIFWIGRIAREHLSPLNFRRLGLVFGFILLVFASSIASYLHYTQKLAPWTGRFYSLWDTSYASKHIPIIASVSEHQPTAWTSFFVDLGGLMILFPAGVFLSFRNLTEERYFVILYSVFASYFAGVMVRLMLTLAPVVCVMSGIAMSSFSSTFLYANKNSKPLSIDSRLAALLPVGYTVAMFLQHSIWVTSNNYSSPTVILTTFSNNGPPRIVDDFREAFYWLRQNTDADAKVLAWWDYGYQIAGLANRTTIVDNNTWNFKHIASVGRILASPEPVAFDLINEIGADYLLIINGGVNGYSGDDINKFLWMVRIAEAVYPEVRERDILNRYGQYRVDEEASEAFKKSLIYKMSYYRYNRIMESPFDRARRARVNIVDLDILEEVYSSDSYLVRIYRVKKPDVFGRNIIEASKFEKLQ